MIEEVKRKLYWTFADHKVKGNDWYDRYRKDEYKAGVKEGWADEEDYLWDSDKCPGKDGSFKRSNCPKPPNCKNEIKKRRMGHT